MSKAAQTIIALRESLKLSKLDLAKALQMTATTIYHYENDIRLPKRKNLLKIIAFAKQHGIEIDPADLLQ